MTKLVLPREQVDWHACGKVQLVAFLQKTSHLRVVDGVNSLDSDPRL